MSPKHLGPVNIAIAVGLLQLALLTSARAQANSGNRISTLQGPAEQSASPIIRDALNRPCLDVEAMARRHTVMPTLFDHVVSVKNNCGRRIKVKVCYYNTDSCAKEFSIMGYSREDTILGSSGAGRFRYSLLQR